MTAVGSIGRAIRKFIPETSAAEPRMADGRQEAHPSWPLVIGPSARPSSIRAVARGESLLDPSVTSKVLQRMRELAAGGHKDPLATLTEQERRILGLIAEGKTNREIASTMYLSEKTVKNYVSTILSKLGMERRTQAAAFMAEQRARGHE